MKLLPLLARTARTYAAIRLAYAYAPLTYSIPLLGGRIRPDLRGDGRIDHVALTFDDGPDPISTPLFLDVLDELGLKATFFLLGTMVDANPHVAREVALRGHEIALHGHWHRNHASRSGRTVRYDMERGLDVVGSTTAVRPLFFRPPYGVFSRATLLACDALDLRPIRWGTWGRDWRRTATPTTVVNDLIKEFRPGVTTLLHDSDCTSYPGAFRSTLHAIEPFAQLVDAQGLTLGPLAEHGF